MSDNRYPMWAAVSDNRVHSLVSAIMFGLMIQMNCREASRMIQCRHFHIMEHPKCGIKLKSECRFAPKPRGRGLCVQLGLGRVTSSAVHLHMI